MKLDLLAIAKSYIDERNKESLKQLIYSIVNAYRFENNKGNYSAPLYNSSKDIWLETNEYLLLNDILKLVSQREMQELADIITDILKYDRRDIPKTEQDLKVKSSESIKKIEKMSSLDKSSEVLDLDSFVGQKDAKDSLLSIIAVAKVNSERQKRDLENRNINFHAVFQGSPGTGKTSFARYYAQEIKKLKILKDGAFKEVSRNDLVSGNVGQTAIKTKKVFESALGGVLLIDEAYTLKKSDSDKVGQECIDMLVKLLEDYRNEIIVIFAGYTDQMQEFLRANPGLKSRIPNIVNFKDFSSNELIMIFDKFIKNYNLNISAENLEFAKEQILLMKKGSHFGNARSVRNFLERCLAQQSVRLSEFPLSELTNEDMRTLVRSDLTKCFDDRGDQLEQVKSPMGELDGLIGLDSVKNTIHELVSYLKIRRKRLDTKELPVKSHMVFQGGPGTGKTTLARLVGSIFKEIGLLPSGHLVEVDRSDLIAGYVGQTAIKTKKVLEGALGGVLFIDEAYSLVQGDEDQFGQEAITTILKFMEDHASEFILVIAGYPTEIETLLESNPGLKSRFRYFFEFQDFNDEELKEIAKIIAAKEKYKLTEPTLDKIISVMNDKQLNESNFANARTVRNILERSYLKHATRLDNEGHNDEDLHIIKPEDIETITKEVIEKKNDSKIGIL